MLGLFLCRWSVSHCVNTFDSLAKKVFQKPQTHCRWILGTLQRVIKCWLYDGCYDVKQLEDSLKLAFGHNRRMFDKAESVSGSKVAVIASDISGAFPFVFSNYNGLEIGATKNGNSKRRML